MHVKGNDDAASAREAGGEADAQRRAEELLDLGVERAEDPVELVVVDGRVVGSWPTRKTASSSPMAKRRAVELQVAAQQVLVERGVVLLGRRHHVGLVVQRALAAA